MRHGPVSLSVVALLALEASSVAQICPVPVTDCSGVSCSLGSGCADGTREGFVADDGAGGYLYPHIAGCSGGWSMPGVMHEVFSSANTISCNVISSYDTVTPARSQAGGSACAGSGNSSSTNPNGSGCNIADLCAPGWHVCTTGGDVQAHLLQKSSTNLVAGTCDDATLPADPPLFFISRQSSNGCGVCANGCRVANPLVCNLGNTGDVANNCDCFGDGCTLGCFQTRNLSNDIFGCGNFGDALVIDGGPLNRFSHNECSAITGGGSPWFCDDHVDASTRPAYWTAGPYWTVPPGSGTCEAYTATKSDATHGGALCCADPVLGPGSCTIDAHCDDGNACTIDSCVAGMCQFFAVTCPGASQCQSAGFCDPSTGFCVTPSLPDGTCCNRGGGGCHIGDACLAGSCVNNASAYPACLTLANQTVVSVANSSGPSSFSLCSAAGATFSTNDANGKPVSLTIPAGTTGPVRVTLAPTGAIVQSVLVSGAALPAGSTKSLALGGVGSTASLCVDDSANAQVRTGSCGAPATTLPQPGAASCFCKQYATGCFCTSVASCDSPPATTPTGSNCGSPNTAVCTALSTLGVGKSVCRDSCSGTTCRAVFGGAVHTFVGEIADEDSDEDGVPNCLDRCPGTQLDGEIPQSGFVFDKHVGDGEVVLGCNATDVLACKPGLNRGERKWGLTPGTVHVFETIDSDNPIAWAAACALMYPRPAPCASGGAP